VQVRAYRIGKTKRAPEWGRKVWEELVQATKNERDDLVKDLNATVKDWKPEHRPGFASSVNIGTSGTVFPLHEESIEIEVNPVGKTEVWGYVTRGTRAHKIRPRRKKALSFMWGGPGSYRPRTHPGPPVTWGGPGQVMNGTRRAFAEVNHPGTKPRRIAQAVEAHARPRWRKRVHEAIERGMYRARMHYI